MIKIFIINNKNNARKKNHIAKIKYYVYTFKAKNKSKQQQRKLKSAYIAKYIIA